MFWQKALFCILSTFIAFSVLHAQSSPKSPTKYASSFEHWIRASQATAVHASETRHVSRFSASAKETNAQKPGSTGLSLVGGILGGVIGFTAGALIGLAADDCHDGSEETLFCNFDTGLYVGSAGGAVLMATGVHLGNGRHGQLGTDLLVSVLIGGVGLGTAITMESGDVLFAVPVIQLIGTVVTERKTTPVK